MKYIVHVTRTRNYEREVEAPSKEEAIKLAEEDQSFISGKDRERTDSCVTGPVDVVEHEYVMEVIRSQSKEYTVHATNIIDAEEQATDLAREDNNWEEPYEYNIGYTEVDGEEI